MWECAKILVQKDYFLWFGVKLGKQVFLSWLIVYKWFIYNTSNIRGRNKKSWCIQARCFSPTFRWALNTLDVLVSHFIYLFSPNSSRWRWTWLTTEGLFVTNPESLNSCFYFLFYDSKLSNWNRMISLFLLLIWAPSPVHRFPVSASI